MTANGWSDREHLYMHPAGPLQIAALGRVLPSAGIYHGYGELMRALLDGRLTLMAVVEPRRAGVLSLLLLGHERI